MKIKAASGITQFQKYKEYDTWFNKLFNVIKSTASFQPEQSVKPDSQSSGSLVVRRAGAQTQVCQQILENKKKRKKGNSLYLSMKQQKKCQRKEKKV